MRNNKHGFNPSNYKVYSVLPCVGKFVMDEEYVSPVTSIVVAAEIRTTLGDIEYYPIEHIYLADAYDEDTGETATRAYHPEDICSVFSKRILLNMLICNWDKEYMDMEGMDEDIRESVLTLKSHHIPICKDVQEFLSEPISIERVRESFPDKQRWGTKENPKE